MTEEKGDHDLRQSYKDEGKDHGEIHHSQGREVRVDKMSIRDRGYLQAWRSGSGAGGIFDRNTIYYSDGEG